MGIDSGVTGTVRTDFAFWYGGPRAWPASLQVRGLRRRPVWLCRSALWFGHRMVLAVGDRVQVVLEEVRVDVEGHSGRGVAEHSQDGRVPRRPGRKYADGSCLLCSTSPPGDVKTLTRAVPATDRPSVKVAKSDG
jgi:hypothetical protein